MLTGEHLRDAQSISWLQIVQDCDLSTLTDWCTLNDALVNGIPLNLENNSKGDIMVARRNAETVTETTSVVVPESVAASSPVPADVWDVFEDYELSDTWRWYYESHPSVTCNEAGVRLALEAKFGSGNIRRKDGASDGLWGYGRGWERLYPSMDGFELLDARNIDEITQLHDKIFGSEPGSFNTSSAALEHAYGGAENVIFVRHKWYVRPGVQRIIPTATGMGRWVTIPEEERYAIRNFYPDIAYYDALKKLYGDTNVKYRLMHDKYYTRYGVRRAQHWTERESERMASRTKPVWVNEQFWVQHQNVHRRHFVHVAETDPRLLSYTVDNDKGEKDIQTPLKPGRYLSKYFAGLLTEKRIAFLSAWQASGQRPPNPFDGLEMKFATTSDEIADVYMRGPTSCMDGRHFKNKQFHPTRVYGAGDLAIAYVEEKLGGKVLSRALVWPEKKAAGRIYPTAEAWRDDGHDSWHDAMDIHDRMRAKLKAAGYTLSAETHDVLFDGARLLSIPLTKEMRDGADPKCHVLMPYMDNNYVICASEDKENIIMTRPTAGDKRALTTGGSTAGTAMRPVGLKWPEVVVEKEMRPGNINDEAQLHLEAIQDRMSANLHQVLEDNPVSRNIRYRVVAMDTAA